MTITYIFVPDFEIEAESEAEAFKKFVDAIEYDLRHYRDHGCTQIEYRLLDELKGEA